MRPRHVVTLFVWISFVLVGVSTTGAQTSAAGTRPRESERQTLLRLHQGILDAHRHNDLDAWMDTESDDYVMVSQGEVHTPDKVSRRERLAPYLANTTFRTYEDLVPPIVRISDDATLAWLIAQVHVVGTQHRPNGTDVDFDVVWAWIELYEKRDGRWLRTGNVSNQRPAVPE
jgi:hypothetical protein